MFHPYSDVDHVFDVLMYSCGICMPCMYPHLLCNVDVMISTLHKCLQDALLSLVGPSSSFRIELHLGRDKLLLREDTLQTLVIRVQLTMVSDEKMSPCLQCMHYGC